MDRRQFLTRVAALGCSAAASPLITPVAFAQAAWDTRLVVIILRGAMDGLDVFRPWVTRILRHCVRHCAREALISQGFLG